MASLAYEVELGSVSAWVDSKPIQHHDETPAEDLEDETEDNCGGEVPKHKRASRQQRRAERKAQKEKATETAATARSSAKNDGVDNKASPTAAAATGTAASASRTDSPSENNHHQVEVHKKHHDHAEKVHSVPLRARREPRLLIPLRTLDSEWKRVAETSGAATTSNSARGSANGSRTNSGTNSPDRHQQPATAQPHQFPERLWRPKTDYSKNPPASVAAERERHHDQQQRASTQPQPGQRREFSTSALRVEWGEAPLPKNAKDLSKVPPLSPKQLEKVTEKLTRPMKRDGPAEAAPPEPLSKEQQEAIVERLTRERKVDDTPRYKIIEPLVLEDEEVENIVKRLSTPRREPEDRRVIPAPPKRKLASLEEQQAVNSRLYQKDFFAQREQKWIAKHGQSEGYVPNEPLTYDQFFKLTSPTSGRRQGAGTSPTQFIG